jgi:hypothetical protein
MYVLDSNTMVRYELRSNAPYKERDFFYLEVTKSI